MEDPEVLAAAKAAAEAVGRFMAGSAAPPTDMPAIRRPVLNCVWNFGYLRYMMSREIWLEDVGWALSYPAGLTFGSWEAWEAALDARALEPDASPLLTDAPRGRLTGLYELPEPHSAPFRKMIVSRAIIAGIWVAFFSRSHSDIVAGRRTKQSCRGWPGCWAPARTRSFPLHVSRPRL